MRLLVLALVAGCGDDVVRDACTATFSGNFSDVTSSHAACPTVSDALDFAIDSRVLGAQAVISIALPAAPAPGDYSSQTLTSWHAVEARSLGNGACVYSAGDEVTPSGSFRLSLAELAPVAHGTLSVTQYVHAIDSADCGVADLERLDVTF